MVHRNRFLNRRDFLTATLGGAAVVQAQLRESRAQETPREVFFERAAEGTPHKGKVLLAVQAHSDDIPLTAAGTVTMVMHKTNALRNQMNARGRLGLNNARSHRSGARHIASKTTF